MCYLFEFIITESLLASLVSIKTVFREPGVAHLQRIMARDKFSKQPSSYPLLAFHLLRLCQVVSSLIVAGVLAFFCYHLRDEGIGIPWTFIVVGTPRT